MSSKATNFHPAVMVLYLPLGSLLFLTNFPPSISSSTNLTELFKAVHLLTVLSSTDLSDELLKSVRAVAAATSGLLKATQPENVEVSNLLEQILSSIKAYCTLIYCPVETSAAALGSWRDGYSGRPAAAACWRPTSGPSNTEGIGFHGKDYCSYHCHSCHQCQVHQI